MKVNTRVRYGLRAMLEIARCDESIPLPISAISESQQISSKYLEQVVGTLRKNDLIVSRKGVHGGYSLARSAEDINLWEIISALDSHTVLVECVDNEDYCERSNDCLTQTIWSQLSQKLQDFWASYTLADLIQNLPANSLESLPDPAKRD